MELDDKFLSEKNEEKVKEIMMKSKNENPNSLKPEDVRKNLQNNSNGNIIRSPVFNYSFEEFYKICHSYYKEIQNVQLSNEKLGKDDVIVIHDLIKEASNYVTNLVKNSNNKEAKELINISLNIVNIFLLIYQNLIHGEKKLVASKMLMYPYSLKLSVLELKFQFYFYFESYEKAEKVLNEILSIQANIDVPKFYHGSALFFLAVLKFLKNNVQESKSIALEALKTLERIGLYQRQGSEGSGNIADENSNTKYFESRLIQKISSVIEFIAEIFLFDNENKQALALYEKAYYLNMGRYGNKNVNTEYFKIKMELLHESKKVKNHTVIREETPSFNKDALNVTDNSISIGNKYLVKIEKTSPNEFQGITASFSFRINITQIYEPLTVEIYDLIELKYIKTLYLDKSRILKRFKLTQSQLRNESIYSKNCLSIILNNFVLQNKVIHLLDNTFMNILINK